MKKILIIIVMKVIELFICCFIYFILQKVGMYGMELIGTYRGYFFEKWIVAPLFIPSGLVIICLLIFIVWTTVDWIYNKNLEWYDKYIK